MEIEKYSKMESGNIIGHVFINQPVVSIEIFTLEIHVNYTNRMIWSYYEANGKDQKFN